MVIRNSDARVTHVLDDLSAREYSRLYLYLRPEDSSHCYFISNPEEVPRFSFRGFVQTRRYISFLKSSGIEFGSISLADTWRQEFLCAIPLSEGGGVDLSRSVVGAWESFTLTEVVSPPAAVVLRCREISSRHEKTEVATKSRGLLDFLHPRGEPLGLSLSEDGVITAKAFLKMLSEGRLDSEMIDVVGRRMPLDECRRLAAMLDTRPNLEKALAAANPQDPWATEAMPALGVWLRGGRPRGAPVKTLRSDFDFLDSASRDGKTSSLPMLLNVLRRQAVEPRKTACVLATARNEGVYFVEWIAHHIALGFEAFFIYTNNNTDSSEQLLEVLANEGVINLIHNDVGQNISPQYKAYGHALQFVPEILDYEWVAAIDLDEFIRIDHNKFTSIGEFLSWSKLSPAESVGLSWKLYGPNKQVFWQDRPVTERFPDSYWDRNSHLKSIFKPRHFFGAQCHFPYNVKYEPRIYRYSDGSEIVEGPFYADGDPNYAWIDHYYLKSIEEMIVRRSRNSGDRPVAADMNADQISTALVGLYLDTSDLEGVSHSTTDEALNQKRQTEMERLMALPGVASALDRCKSALRAEVNELKSRLAEHPRFKTPGSLENRLLELLFSKS